MKTETRKVIWYFGECKKCSYSFEFPTAFEDMGVFTGYSKRQETAFLDLFGDEVFFDEVSNLIDVIMVEWETEMWRINVAVLKMWGYVCDPAPSGLRYNFAGPLSCPRCGFAPVSYGPYRHGKESTSEVVMATHENWDWLTSEQKRMKLIKALKDEGCLADNAFS